MADPGRVEQVLSDLLSNAAKYGYPDTEILVEVARRDAEASATDPSYFPGGPIGSLYQRLAHFHLGPGDTLSAQLAARGYHADAVRIAILSHLHEDHIGGIRELHSAEFVVAEAEWAALQEPNPELRGFLRRHIDVPGLAWRRITFEPTTDPALAPFDAASAGHRLQLHHRLRHRRAGGVPRARAARPTLRAAPPRRAHR